jgi:hypothetical protein
MVTPMQAQGKGTSTPTNTNTVPTTTAETSANSSTHLKKPNYIGIAVPTNWWTDNLINGSQWTPQYRQEVILTEPDVMDRVNDPVSVNLTFTGNVAHVNSIRLTVYNNTGVWIEFASQLTNIAYTSAAHTFYASCTIVFMVNITMHSTQIYYVYYDPKFSTPAHASESPASLYTCNLEVTGRTSAHSVIPTDVHNPTVNYANGTAAQANCVSLDVIYNDTAFDSVNPAASISLVDTNRAGSDWGGPCCSIYHANYWTTGSTVTDALNEANQEWTSLGDMALDPLDYDTITNQGGGYSNNYRVNVGPDNPVYAWDNKGLINVTDQGPIFCTIKIHTTDGAYATIDGSNGANWYQDGLDAPVTGGASVTNGSYWQTTDADTPAPGDYGLGYVKYDFSYTFYYYKPQLMCQIGLKITADPMRGLASAGYQFASTDYVWTYNTVNYYNTGVWFKNYGDWPHIMQIVQGNGGHVPQTVKSWDGIKSGIITMNNNLTAKYNDFPIQPWAAWYQYPNVNSTPTDGMFAVTNPDGWQVLSLAVSGIGPNTMLQQILPEGLQGSNYLLPRLSVLKYNYYYMTDSQANNYSTTQNMCQRMNNPITYSLPASESYSSNIIVVHTNDISNTAAKGIDVQVLYSANGTMVRMTNGTACNRVVNSASVASFYLLKDTIIAGAGKSQYVVECFMQTTYLATNYSVYATSFYQSHTVNRTISLTATCNCANFTVSSLKDLATGAILSGVLVEFENYAAIQVYSTGTVGVVVPPAVLAAAGTVVEQYITIAGAASFRLYTTGATQYRILTVYGGTNATNNVTGSTSTSGAAYKLTGDTTMMVGMQDTGLTQISIQTQQSSVTLGQTATLTFYYVLVSSSTNEPAATIALSTNFGSVYWNNGKDYTWSQSGTTELVTLTLNSGFSRKLNSAGITTFYITAESSTLANATTQVTLTVNPIATTLGYQLNSTSTTQITVVKPYPVNLTVGYYTLGPGYSTSGPKTMLTNVTTGGGSITYSVVSSGTQVETGNLGFSSKNNNYTVLIPTISASMTINTYVVTVSVTFANYQSQTTTFVLVVNPRPTSMVLSSPGVSDYGVDTIVQITLTDTLSQTGVNTVASNIQGTVQGTSNPSVSATGSNGNFQIDFPSSYFTALGTYTLVIVFSWSPSVSPYYQSQTATTTALVINRGDNLVSSSVSSVQYGQSFSFTITYTDTVNSTGIGKNATAFQFNGAAANASNTISSLGGGVYQVAINTTQFSHLGTFSLTISIPAWTKAPFYSAVSVTDSLVLAGRGDQLVSSAVSPVQYGQSFSFTITYIDTVNSTGIGKNATAFQFNGAAANASNTISSLGGGVYQVAINTTQFSHLGTFALNISIVSWTKKPFYTKVSVVDSLVVTARGDQLVSSAVSPVQYGQSFSFTITYTDTVNSTGIGKNASAFLFNNAAANASNTISSLGAGVYQISVNTTQFSHLGTFALNISIVSWTKKPFYTKVSVADSLVVTARGDQLVSSAVSPVQYGQSFSFTITYIDTVNSTGIGKNASAFLFNNAAANASNTISSLGAGVYQISVNTTQFSHLGTFAMNISIVSWTKKPFYTKVSVADSLVVTARGDQLVSSAVSPAQYGQSFSFTITYTDTVNSTGISKNASAFTFSFGSTGNGSIVIGSGVNGVYQITVYTTQFTHLGTFNLTISIAAWTKKPFYPAVSITDSLKVTQRSASLTASLVSNVQFGQNITINAQFQDSVNGSLIKMAVSGMNVVVSQGAVIYSGLTISSTGGSGSYQFNIATWNLPSTGSYSVNVSTNWLATRSPYYANQYAIVTVIVSPRSDLFYAGSEVYKTYEYGSIIRITLYYIDSVNGSTITNTTGRIKASLIAEYPAAVNNTVISKITLATSPITYYPGNTSWVIQFNSANFGNPASNYRVFLNFTWSATGKPFYVFQAITFTISTSIASTELVLIGSLVQQANVNDTLSFYYISSASGLSIAGATITVDGNTTSPAALRYHGYMIWNGTASFNGTRYLLSFNVTAEPSSITAFTIAFSAGTNYNTATDSFSLVRTNLGSQITITSTSGSRILGQNESLVVQYTYQGGALINDAQMVISSGLTSSGQANIWTNKTEYYVTMVSSGLYNVTIRTGLGTSRINSTSQFYTIYINMSTSIAQQQLVSYQFQMQRIPTSIPNVYINGTSYTASVTTEITKSLNITAEYDSNFPGASAQKVTGASVVLSSASLSSQYTMSASHSLYMYTLPMSKLGVGTFYLYVTANLTNYEEVSTTIVVVVTNVGTTLTTYLNSNMNASTTSVVYGQDVNISAYYYDKVDSTPITGSPATVTLTGGVLNVKSWSLSVVSHTWELTTFNSTWLGTPATYTITLTAQDVNYVSAVSSFTIQVLQVPTSLASVNGTTFSPTWGTNFDLSVQYMNTYTSTSISGASMSASVSGTVMSNYDMRFNASVLGIPGSYNIVVTLMKGNYTTQSLTFIVNVQSIPTTATPLSSSYNVNWGSNVAVTEQYSDTLHSRFIGAASVSAGTYQSAVLGTPTYASGTYTITFSGRLLAAINGLGVYVVSLSFSKTDYATIVATVTIAVNAIPTTISIHKGAVLNSTLSAYYNNIVTFNANFATTSPVVSITNATSVMAGAYTSTNTGNGSYAFSINATSLGTPNIYTVAITATLANYATATTSITIQVLAIKTVLIVENFTSQVTSAFNLYYGMPLQVQVLMQDLVHGVSLSNWKVSYSLAPASNVTAWPAIQAQWRNLLPGAYTITISASKANYMSPSSVITVVVNKYPTSLTTAASYSVTWGNTLRINAVYTDTWNGTTIDATVASITSNMKVYESSQVNTTNLGTFFYFNTALMAVGVYTFTFSASLANYNPATTSATVTVSAVPTELAAYTESPQQVATAFSGYWGTTIVFDVAYTSIVNGTKTAWANTGTITVSLTTGETSGVSSVNASNIAYSYNTNLGLTPGIYTITISAAKANYLSQSEVVTLTVNTVPTAIQAYVLGTNTVSTSYNVYWNDQLQFDVRYWAPSTNTNLTTVGGTNVAPGTFPGTPGVSSTSGRVTITVNTNTLTVQVYSITITTSQADYVTQSISITINVMAVPTMAQTYNGTMQSASFSAVWGTTFSVGVEYSRTYLPASLAGATYTSSTPYVSEHYAAPQYIFTFNASAIGATGVYSITFTMSLTNFATSAAGITLTITSVQTAVTIQVNSSAVPAFSDITANRSYQVNFNNKITLQLNYTTTGDALLKGAQAEVQFIEGSSYWKNYGPVNATILNKTSGSYWLTLNTTTNLGNWGQYSMIVTFTAPNYEAQSQTFYIYPVKLRTELFLSSSLKEFPNLAVNVTDPVQPGQKFTINDTATFVIYCALIDLSVPDYIPNSSSISYIATMNGVNYAPASILHNGTAEFLFDTASIKIAVGTSNFITFSGDSGIYYSSGNSINLEVLTVPTNITVYSGATRSSQISPGQTLSLYYSQSMSLNVVYTDILNDMNITATRFSNVTAAVYAQTINSTYMGNGIWQLYFNSYTLPIAAGSTPQVIITAVYQNRTTATFSFNLALLQVPSAISVYWYNTTSDLYQLITAAGVNQNWSDILRLKVYYNNTLSGFLIGNTNDLATIQATFGINPVYIITGGIIGNAFYTVDVNTSLLTGGSTHTVIVSASYTNYTSAQFSFNLNLRSVPTQLFVRNGTTNAYLNNTQTVRVYWGDTVTVLANFQDTSTGNNVSGSSPLNLRAIVLSTTITASFVGGTSNDWAITINTKAISGLNAGSTPQVVITGTLANYTDAVFSFNLQILAVPTQLDMPALYSNTLSVVWGENFSFNVTGYYDTHNDVFLNGSIVSNYPAELMNGGYANKTWGYNLLYNSTAIGVPGIYRITLTASLANYASASFTVTVQILDVPTNMTVYIDGKDASKYLAQPTLKDVINVSISYDLMNGEPILGALVKLLFTNNTNNAGLAYVLNYSHGMYTMNISLNLNTFYAEPKFLTISAYKANYTNGEASPIVNVQKIPVTPLQIVKQLNQANITYTATGFDVSDLKPNSPVTFQLQLFDNTTKTGIAYNTTTIYAQVTCTELNIFSLNMTYIGNGTFQFEFTTPSQYGRTITFTVDTYQTANFSRQFNVQAEYSYRFTTEKNPSTGVPAWVFYLILAALMVLTTWFILYQVRFKYPPIIRKIMDLSRSIRRGKASNKIHAQNVPSREENIFSEYAKVLNDYSFLQTRARVIGRMAKAEKEKGKGYVAPTDTLAEEYSMGTEQHEVEIQFKTAVPPALPKEGPKKGKGYQAPAAQATEEETKPSEAPSVPAGKPELPVVKPPSPAAMPKPAAKMAPLGVPETSEEVTGQEGLYGELVRLEQKKYKAQRSIRDLKAKKEKGILSDEEYNQYLEKFEEALNTINERIAAIRRKLVNV